MHVNVTCLEPVPIYGIYYQLWVLPPFLHTHKKKNKYLRAKNKKLAIFLSREHFVVIFISFVQ